MRHDDLSRSVRTRPAVYWVVCIVTIAATWFGGFFFATIATAIATMEKDKDGRIVSRKGELAPYIIGICVGSLMAGIAAWRLRRRYRGRRFSADDAPFSPMIGVPGKETQV